MSKQKTTLKQFKSLVTNSSGTVMVRVPISNLDGTKADLVATVTKSELWHLFNAMDTKKAEIEFTHGTVDGAEVFTIGA